MFKTLCPRDYNEVLHVGHYFRTGTPVVMDLTGLPDGEATQFVDFAAGLVFGRGGDMDRLSPKVFLLLPRGMARRPSPSPAARPDAASPDADETP